MHYNNRVLYLNSFSDFISSNSDKILGTIVNAYHGSIQTTQSEAWKAEIELLQSVLLPWKSQDAYILFEYDIPRLGKRIDVVLLLCGMIFCLEFKVGQADALQCDVEQVLDYALDLKCFHLYSVDKPIVPILVPTNYKKCQPEIQNSPYDDQIYNPVIVGRSTLQSIIANIVECGQKTIDPKTWGMNWLISPYSPTPTIVEAARVLYENHSVEEITRHEADNVSTDATIQYLLNVIAQSEQNKQKSICFVTECVWRYSE